MPDFSWTRHQAQIPSRQVVHTAFEPLGFRFRPTAPTGARHQRPRTTGTTPDQRARLELIGPADVVFKATLLLDLPLERLATAALPRALTEFLHILVPAWEAGPTWVAAQAATLARQGRAATRVGEALVTLRGSADGHRVVLGYTWQP